MIEQIKSGVTVKRIRGTGEEKMANYIKRYYDDVINKKDILGSKRRVLSRVRSFTVMLGARKIKQIITGNRP